MYLTSEVSQTMLFIENEWNGVVTKATTRMARDRRRLVDGDDLICLLYDLYGFICHRKLVPEMRYKV